MKYCPFCGSQLDDDMVFCPDCGKRFVTAETISFIQNDSTPFGTEYTEQHSIINPPQEKKQSKPYRKNKKWLIPVCIVLVLVILGGVYCAPYFFARKGNFAAAGKLIISPAIYDNKLVNYVVAGLKIEAGEYNEAEKMLQELPEDYLDRTGMIHESMYQRALWNVEKHSYDVAVSIMKKLRDVGYKDAAEQCDIIRYDEAHYYLDEKNDTLKAYRTMKALADSGYKKAQTETNGLKNLLYSEMQENYKSGNYRKVITMSEELGDYKESARYGLLASIKENYYNLSYKGKAYTVDKIAPVLLGMTNFEDALKTLVYNQGVAKGYLKGTWKTKTGTYYFKIDGNGNSSYNLPSNNSKKYYTIEKGYFIAYNKTSTESGAVKEYKITPVSKTQIKIYAYKDKKTYTLYKQ